MGRIRGWAECGLLDLVKRYLSTGESRSEVGAWCAEDPPSSHTLSHI